MRSTPFRGALAGALVLLLLALPADALDAPRYRGRPVHDVLRELQREGLELIFSTAVVGDELLVLREPVATEPRRVLKEILEPLGLAAQDGPDGTILIVPRAAVGVVHGRVVTKPAGAPVEGAGIRLKGSDLVTNSGRDGRFEISDVPQGRCEIHVSARGFIAATVGAVAWHPDAAAELVVALEALPSLTASVVVTPGRHSILREEQAPRRMIDPADALRAPTIGGDVSRLVELVPGVAAGDNSAAFHMRGSATRDVSFILDGLELYDSFHLQSLQSPFSVIDASMVGRLDVLQGGFTAELGDRHGGFVQVETLAAEVEPAGEVEIGTLNSRAIYRSPRAGRWLASGRAWYPSALFETIEYGGEEQLDPRAIDLYAKGDLFVGRRVALSAHALLARDSVEFTETDEVIGEQVDVLETSGYAWLRMYGSWAPGWSSETLLSLGRLERERDGVAVPEESALDVRDHRSADFAGIKHDTVYELSSSRAVKAGLELRQTDARYRYNLTDSADPEESKVVALDPDGVSLAAYAAYRAAWGEQLAIEAGVRWDRQDYTGDSQLSPRFNAVYRPGPRSELRLALGRFRQSQRIHELEVEDGETEFLPAEASRQIDCTVQHELTRGLGLRLDAYYRTLSRLRPRYESLYAPFELFPEAAADRVRIEPESARLRGAELLLSGRADGPWLWWVSYAWSSAEDSIEGETVPRSWDQTNAARFLIGYRREDKFWIALTGAAHTGWPTTPATAELVSDPADPAEYAAVPGPRNSQRYPTHMRLDFKARQAIALSRGRMWLTLEVVNLTDRQNPCCVGDFLFKTEPDGTTVAVPEFDYWIGVTPSFAVSWEF